MQDDVLYSHEDGVALVTLNQSDAFNALNLETMTSLSQRFY